MQQVYKNNLLVGTVAVVGSDWVATVFLKGEESEGTIYKQLIAKTKSKAFTLIHKEYSAQKNPFRSYVKDRTGKARKSRFTVIIKVDALRWHKIDFVNNPLKLAAWLSSKHPAWRFANVYSRKTKLQVGSFTKTKLPYLMPSGYWNFPILPK